MGRAAPLPPPTTTYYTPSELVGRVCVVLMEGYIPRHGHSHLLPFPCH